MAILGDIPAVILTEITPLRSWPLARDVGLNAHPRSKQTVNAARPSAVPPEKPVSEIDHALIVPNLVTGIPSVTKKVRANCLSLGMVIYLLAPGRGEALVASAFPRTRGRENYWKGNPIPWPKFSKSSRRDLSLLPPWWPRSS